MVLVGKVNKYRVTFWYPAKYQKDVEASSSQEAYVKTQNKMFESNISEWELCPDEMDHEILEYNNSEELIYNEIIT